MVLVNELTKLEKRPHSILKILTLLLSPFAPHLSEELWRQLGHSESLAYHPWPQYHEEFLIQDEIEIVIQVNGKLRGSLKIPSDLPHEKYEQIVKDHPSFQKWTSDKSLKKIVTVPKKLVNLVVT